MWLNHPRKGYIMEKSNKKLANTVLYYVIGLCFVVIIAVTLMTASSKKAPPSGNVSEDITDTTSTQAQSDNERTYADTSRATESESTSADTQTSNNEVTSAEKETKPVVNEQKETYFAPVN